MTMRNTFFLMVLAGAVLQHSWAGDKAAINDGGLLPPPPPGPFMSAGERGGVPENALGMRPLDMPEQSWDEMPPPMEAMSQDWPEGDFYAPANMPPTEFQSWDNQAMPPMPQGMGNHPPMGEMPPPEFPAWSDQGMPEMRPMDQGWPEMPPRGEFTPPPPPSYRMRPPEYPNYQRPPPMPGGYPMPPQGYRNGPPGWSEPTFGASPYVE